MSWKRLRLLILVMIAAGMVFWCGNALAESIITNMRYFVAPDHTRIVFDLTEPPAYSTSREDSTLIITFQETTCSEVVPRETGINKAGIGKMTIITLTEGDVLVRLILGAETEANVFPLKKFQDKPDRLVIDIELPEVSRQESRMREQIKVSKTKKIIVIDPGHGGDDPGAVGKRGTHEKDVVLDISRRLKKTLDRHGRYHAYLTRNGDYYVPFNKRLQIAREYGADLFISIHADAAKNRDARGSSVYCLSTGGASSVAANILAQNENLADIVGGVRDEDLKDETNPILINMCQTNTINVSKAFGMSVLWELSNIGDLKFEKVQEAPFRVLKMPEIPAVLIETAYISNPEEEKLLRSPAFQKKIADTVSRTVVQFFSPDTPGEIPAVLVQGAPPAVPADTRASQPLPRLFFLYTVAKGDTLNKVARRFDVTVSSLLTLNKMAPNETLYVGRRLKIEGEQREPQDDVVKTGSSDHVAEPANGKVPVTDDTGGKDRKTFVYTVVKGDTLAQIAARFGMPLADLLRKNGLNIDALLFVGKRLQIVGENDKDSAGATGKTADIVTERKTPQESGKQGTGKSAKRNVSVYTVVKGDTLSRIAERFNMSLADLMELNGMRKTRPLYVGERLKIAGDLREAVPGSKQGEKNTPQVKRDKRAYRTYKVKQGDTLLDIAQEQGITVATLLELNRMKLDDPLYRGRILILGDDRNP